MPKQHLRYNDVPLCGVLAGEMIYAENYMQVDCKRCIDKYLRWLNSGDTRVGDISNVLSPVRVVGIEAIASPDAETEINEAGGKQSHIPVRFDLIDAKALFEQAKVLHEGAVKYGENNWRLIPVEDHLNHLIMHAYAYLAGDRTDEHLSHIMCRATFAQGVAIEDEERSEA